MSKHCWIEFYLSQALGLHLTIWFESEVLIYQLMSRFGQNIGYKQVDLFRRKN